MRAEYRQKLLSTDNDLSSLGEPAETAVYQLHRQTRHTPTPPVDSEKFGFSANEEELIAGWAENIDRIVLFQHARRFRTRE